MADRALMHQDWFLLLCPRHRPDSVAKVFKGSGTEICHHGPTPELISRLEHGDITVFILLAHSFEKYAFDVHAGRQGQDLRFNQRMENWKARRRLI